MTAKTPSFTSIPEALRVALDSDGPVNERLALFAETLRALEPAFTGVVDSFVARLTAVGADASAPAVGEPMPDFVLPDEQGRLRTLDEFLAAGPTVVALHRGHWCPYCMISTRALAQAHGAIRAAGGSLVVITPERAEFAAKLRTFAGADYPVLVDLDNGYALSLNLAIWFDGLMRDGMSGFGVDLPAYQGNSQWMLPIPATFVIGRDGRVSARFIDPDFRRRMEVASLLHEVTAAAARGG